MVPIDFKDVLLLISGAILGAIPSFIKLRRDIEACLTIKRIKNYDKIMCNQDFIKFRNAVLEKYYDSYWTCIEGRNFPVYVFEGKSYPFPFLELGELELENNKFNEKNDFKKNKYYTKYQRILSGKIKRPENPGYMLDKLKLSNDNKVIGFCAWVGTYEQNVYTSHILEYELYVMFKKHKNCTDNNYKKIEKELTIRNNIHLNKIPRDVLETGCNRASLLGVQLIILFKDHTDNYRYKVVMFQRGTDVASRPNFYQFPPSGGFEVYDYSSEPNENELRENFSVVNAIFREYAEEIFGDENFITGIHGEGIFRINNHPEVERIKQLIQNGKAHFEFLGSIIDLIGLRNELSFVLRIDDKDFSRNFNYRRNHESKKFYFKSICDVIDIIKDKNIQINEGSAGLWYLFCKNHLFEEIKNNE